MTLYYNANKSSDITSVEFSKLPEGNATFIHLKEGADKDAAKQWLKDLGQKIEAETALGKETVIISRGAKSEAEVMASLKDQGNSMEAPEPKGKLNLWKARGWASMIGQPMQLFSGILAKGPPDVSTAAFAILNLTANATNIAFGQQDENDVHHLRTVKRGINDVLDPHFAEEGAALDVNDHRAALRKTDEKRSFGGKIYDFAKRNSVVVGEIGLRYLAAIALVLPVKKAIDGGDPNVLKYDHWKKGAKELLHAELKTAWHTLRNTDRATRIAGLTYIAGKSIALVTKPEDPYNPEKPGIIEKFREKVAFRMSSVIETVAAAVIAADRLNIVKIKNDKGVWTPRTISYDKLIGAYEGVLKHDAPKFLKEKAGQFTKRDWLGGIGGVLFTGGLIIRIFAPFGEKKVNMEEVEAHATDSLARVSREKLPQALAETTAYLTDHFKENHLEYGNLYNKLANDLYHYHHIPVIAPDDGKPVEQAPQLEVTQADNAMLKSMGIAPEPVTEKEKSFASDNLKKPDLASMPPAASFQERAAVTQGEVLQRA